MTLIDIVLDISPARGGNLPDDYSELPVEYSAGERAWISS